jgi:hypothetical protein
VKYNDQEDFLLYLMLSKPSRKQPSGRGVQWLLFFAFVFILWLLCHLA